MEQQSPYVSNDEMTEYVANAVDTWADTLGALIAEVADLADEVNGEFVGEGLRGRLIYLLGTKAIIKEAIESFGVRIPDETPFRKYAEYIKMIPVIAFTPAVSVFKKLPVTLDIAAPLNVIGSVRLNTSYTVKPPKTHVVNMQIAVRNNSIVTTIEKEEQ